MSRALFERQGHWNRKKTDKDDKELEVQGQIKEEIRRSCATSSVQKFI